MPRGLTMPTRRLFTIEAGRLVRDEGGAVALIFALVISILLGLLGLGVEIGSWYTVRRDLQTAADAAALAAALERSRGKPEESIAQALREAQRNGFVQTEAGYFVINSPPQSGALAGHADAVEAILRDRRRLMFSRLFLQEDPVIAARAVAAVGTGGEACVLALHPTAPGAIRGSGTADIMLPGCLLASNSTDEASINLTGVVVVNALSVTTAGQIAQTSNVTVNLDYPPTEQAPPLRDPYADVEVGAVPPCDFTSEVKVTNNHTRNFDPGVYCAGIAITGGTANFKAGTYYIVDSGLTVNGGTLRGVYSNELEGVTFVFTTRNVTGTAIGGVDIRGNPTMKLRAPADEGNPFRGILFFQDRRASPGATNKFNGNSNMELQGAIYFPSQEVQWNGNNATGSADCIQVVARTVSFLGTSKLGVDHCGDRGERRIVVARARLRE